MSNHETIQKTVEILQKPMVSIPSAAVGGSVSTYSWLEMAGTYIGLIGGLLGITLTTMLIIINWKPLKKAVKGWTKAPFKHGDK